MLPEFRKAADLAYREWVKTQQTIDLLTKDAFQDGYLAGRSAGIIVIGPLNDSMKDIPGIQQFDTWNQAYIHLRRTNAANEAGTAESYRPRHRSEPAESGCPGC